MILFNIVSFINFLLVIIKRNNNENFYLFIDFKTSKLKIRIVVLFIDIY